jgi:hypothetical protein
MIILDCEDSGSRDGTMLNLMMRVLSTPPSQGPEGGKVRPVDAAKAGSEIAADPAGKVETDRPCNSPLLSVTFIDTLKSYMHVVFGMITNLTVIII